MSSRRTQEPRAARAPAEMAEGHVPALTRALAAAPVRAQVLLGALRYRRRRSCPAALQATRERRGMRRPGCACRQPCLGPLHARQCARLLQRACMRGSAEQHGLLQACRCSAVALDCKHAFLALHRWVTKEPSFSCRLCGNHWVHLVSFCALALETKNCGRHGRVEAI